MKVVGDDGMYCAQEVINELKKSRQTVIFGGGMVANEVANCLMGNPYYFDIAAFLVTDLNRNPTHIVKKEVVSVYDGVERYKDALVLVAVAEKYLDEVMEILRETGYQKIIPMTFESDLWSDIRENYYKELRISQGRSYLVLEEELAKTAPYGKGKPDCSIYRAKCHMDRVLEEDISVYDWEKTIQVGKALTDQKISEICDDVGENISNKNKEYCELTALYWIWKNDHSKYAGLCHYRRHFRFNEEMLYRLQNSDIDVVLTIPILNFPSVRDVYAHDHIEKDWDIMLEAVRELQPDYYETLDKLQKGNFYYGYNMLVAKKEILDQYCEWLFPLLFYCESKCDRKDTRYQGRYIGFLAERLLSVFFLYHENEYKIVHAKKHFVEK